MKIKFIFLLTFVVFYADAQVYVARGKVLDKNSQIPLGFVTILYGNSRTQGVNTNINGQFEIKTNKPITKLEISYIGYKKQTVYLNQNTDNKLNKEIKIFLEVESIKLKEIDVFAKENPAHRIIKEVYNHRKENNPEKMESFSYTAYQKSKVFVDFNNTEDTLNKYFIEYAKRKSKQLNFLNISLFSMDSSTYSNDSIRQSNWKKDSIEQTNFFKKKDLFLMESINEHKFKKPDNHYQKVVANRVSGLQNPIFTLLTSQIQSLSFYKNYVSFASQNYLSPLSRGSTRNYLFILRDTLYHNNDSIFVIAFRPGKGKNFKGLEGILYINSNKYALQFVIASPYESAFIVNFTQKYEFLRQKQWFPTQLNAKLLIPQDSTKSLIFKSNYFIKNVKLNPQLKNKEFKRTAIELTNKAHKQPDSLWNKYRQDTIMERETKTYQFWDSVGRAENLDKKILGLRASLRGNLQWGFFDFHLDKFIKYNKYEKTRLGVGGMTNDNLLRWFKVGGYLAYATCGEFRYGANVIFDIWREKELQLAFDYYNDVREYGKIDFVFDKKSIIVGDAVNFILDRMYKVQHYGARLSFNTLKYLKIHVSALKNQQKITDDYRFQDRNNKGEDILKSKFTFSELGLGFRYAYKEKIIKTPFGIVVLPTKYPIISGEIRKGINMWQGEYQYTSYHIKIQKTFKIRNVGHSKFSFKAGYVDSDVPYTNLINPKGNNLNILNSENSYETMGTNEFVVNKFVGLHYSHNFGNLLIKKKKFRPEFILVHNTIYGTCEYTKRHISMEIKDLENVFLESGLVVNNIWGSFGMGVFFRYGFYQKNELVDNFSFKLTINLKLLNNLFENKK